MIDGNSEWGKLAGHMAIGLAAAYLVSFFYKMIKVRLIFYRLKKQGMPMPPWNPILGHLHVVVGLSRRAPSDMRQADSFGALASHYPELQDGFYLDVWPFGVPMLLVSSLELAVQACQTYDLPKPDVLAPIIGEMAGGPNIFVTNGAEWKRARELFNHGFSMSAVMARIPHIIEEANVFADILREHARKGDTFLLDHVACNYVMDVIGNEALNTRFRYQQGYNPIAASMRDTIQWSQAEAANPFYKFNPVRFFKQWRNSRTMNHYIGIELEKRYQEWLQNRPKPSTRPTRHQSIMDMTIAEYMKTRAAGPKLDPEFKTWATFQIRLFLFVGHDSTAATIIFCLYQLSKHPDILAKVRAEHDEVCGPYSAVELLRQRPVVINQLRYTSAVIKETLRLHPPANGLRDGLPGVVLQGQNGRVFPVEGFAIWNLHGAIQRNANSWPEPGSFIPDRWLVKPGHPLYPPNGGWRPFEHGPRNCVGQNMSLVTIKVTLLMIVREFDIHDQYVEWDRLHPSAGIRTMDGERAYMVQKGSGHPAQGFPCKVLMAS
ncbi:putative N-alkane-inducible cytochrome P450 [Aspergillus bertholletiae]|uniref:Putative N-alkane-inducible cytochrome P450 n=1 Tax=Aspergillus bertholletiae TaxID=1226010 RepID=A0A5N7BN89_9EURO|nr:putative N-alkane-inducible cytochrome P450 [Aspergillus bertholletiae]